MGPIPPSTRIYCYILRHDSGFAPNPFHGWCTLACCKPGIRRTAGPGNWIVGISPRKHGNRLVYAMRVKESLSFKAYWRDPRFQAKRPRWDAAEIVGRCGDNCYRYRGHGEYEQVRRSGHWGKDDRENLDAKQHDLRGKHVLVARRFCYYGVDAIEFPFPFATPGRFTRVNFQPAEQAELLAFLEDLPQGVRGKPRRWPDDDTSWKRRLRCG